MTEAAGAAPPRAGGGAGGRDDDERLLTRLRDLSLVDVDALLTGSAGERYAELLVTYADDLADALSAARARAAELLRVVTGGPDPLALLDAGHQVRARDGGRDGAARTAERLAARARACRQLARIDDLTAALFPRLLEADRRRASLGTASD